MVAEPLLRSDLHESHRLCDTAATLADGLVCIRASLDLHSRVDVRTLTPTRSRGTPWAASTRSSSLLLFYHMARRLPGRSVRHDKIELLRRDGRGGVGMESTCCVQDAPGIESRLHGLTS